MTNKTRRQWYTAFSYSFLFKIIISSLGLIAAALLKREDIYWTLLLLLITSGCGLTISVLRLHQLREEGEIDDTTGNDMSLR